MLDRHAEITPDRRPGILICDYEPGHSGWDLIEDLSGEVWSPEGVQTMAVGDAADTPDGLALDLSARLLEPNRRALLLIGRTPNAGFEVQMRAENRALGGAGRLDDIGPGVARTTAPVAEMISAIRNAGLNAHAQSEGENDMGSYLLYRVLSALPDDADTPAVGLLRAPHGASEAEIKKAVKAVVNAIALRLSPMTRPKTH